MWAPVAYEGPARALVGALKFRGAQALAGAMAAQIAAGVPERLRAGRALVPVPLHPSRLRARGFNQAERLARSLAERTGMRVADCLVRTDGGGHQMGRARRDRLNAVATAVRPGADPPRGAVLVDDVVTTGATLGACAAAFRAAGAEPLGGLAYARTSGR